MHSAALLSLGSAFCYAVYSITTRMLSRTDSSETTLFYANLVGCRRHGAGAAVRLDHAADRGSTVVLMVAIGRASAPAGISC